MVVGAGGFFGRNVAELLRADGLRPVSAGRSGELVLDAEDPRSIAAALRPDDIVIDAAGPFQERTTALLEGAIATGAHYIDLNESFDYALRVEPLAEGAAGAGLAVLSSCSAVSTVTAALVRLSGVDRPRRVSALVAPAAALTAHHATLRALLAYIGKPVEVVRDGQLVRATGWREVRQFRLPQRRAYLVGSALPLTLPGVWPTLREVDCWADTGTLGANAILSVVARSEPLQAVAGRATSVGAFLARLFGPRRGAFAIEVEDEAGQTRRLALGSRQRSYLIAAAPAALAARALAEGRFHERGLVPADRHVAPEHLVAYLRGLGIQLRTA